MRKVLEQSSNREVHSALPCRARAGGERNRANKSVSDYTQIEASSNYHRSGISCGAAESAAGFVPSAPVNSAAHQLRQPVELAPKSECGVRIVISQKLLRKVRSQPELPAQRKDLERSCVTAKCGAARSQNEQGSRRTHGNKTRGLDVELTNGMVQ